MSTPEPKGLKATLDKLTAALGENLYSCILYGSAAGPNFTAGRSDINLLIVLNESTPEAHAAITEAIAGPDRIEPFVLGREGIERSMCAFAVKFVSIRRNYRLLHGADPLASINIQPPMLRFLCEQAIRNRRLRLVHAFIATGRDTRRYQTFISRAVSNAFSDIAEALRCEGIDVPASAAERLTVFERELPGIDAVTLRELLKLKTEPRDLSIEEAKGFHSALFRLMNCAVKWMEQKWPTQPLPKQN